MRDDWLVWQLADSAFPAGALAHSSGLEAAVQSGLVTDGESLRVFVLTILHQLECGVGVFARRVWVDPDRFAENDAECDLFLNSAVTNRASRAQGRAFLATAAQTFDIEVLKRWAADIRREKGMGHLAPIFGLVCRSVDLDCSDAISLFVFTTARGCLSSAVRLGVVGPLEAQRIQATLASSEAITCEDPRRLPTQTAPFLDLLQSTQERLYSRLFQS